MSEKTFERNLHKIPDHEFVAVFAGESYSKALTGGARCRGEAAFDGVAVDGILVRPQVLAALLAKLGWKVKEPKRRGDVQADGQANG